MSIRWYETLHRKMHTDAFQIWIGKRSACLIWEASTRLPSHQ